MDFSDAFKGKKITLMGLGLLGRGIGDAKYLASVGADLIVTDLKSADALASSVAELAEFPNVTFVLGEHRLEDFRGRDLIVKAAGVPLNSPYIEEARKEGTHIAMSGALLAKLTKLPCVGVTGTRGKSTVTHMIDEILKADGRKTLLAGNVRGVSNLALLPQATSEHTLVMELDSWQLQGFAEEGISPQVSVFTTFFPDHLNYYNGDLEAYLNDKAHIFRNQTKSDTLVLGSQARGSVQGAYPDIRSKVVIAGDEFPSDWTLAIPGGHNRYNAALALAAARALGVEDAVTKEALERFSALPGRLEFVREVNGVRVYNDNNSTTPEATTVALKALDTGTRNIILIMGGADKTLAMDALLAELPARTKKVLLLAGTGTERIKSELPDAAVYDSLAAAVTDAMSAARAGDVVLFSPAFASFGMFKNEYDRGDQFVELVQQYA